MGIEVLSLVRHGQSEYNHHRANLIKSEPYSRFLSRLSSLTGNEEELDTLAGELADANKSFEETDRYPLN